jgi:hypothetical protein
MREAIADKDRALAGMERELLASRQQLACTEAAVDGLRLRVKQTHIATATIKRRHREEVPPIQIPPKALERTRLGGGFDLVQSARTPRQPDQDGAERAARPDRRPPSARTDSTTSWLPRNPVPAAEPTAPQRTDADAARRWPRVAVGKQAKRGRTGSPAHPDPPGRPSARSSRPGGSARPQVKLHTTIVQF